MLALRYRVLVGLLVVGLCCVVFRSVAQDKPAGGLDKVSLALQWVTQCQFAGYYVALEKGYYREEGLDLVIRPGASDINPILLVSGGSATFGTKWMADLLAAREKEAPIVSVAQILQSNGLVLIAKAKSGIKTPQDFIGKRLGIWFFGNEVQVYTLLNQLHIPHEAMTIKPLKWSIEPFLQDDFDVITAMTYNEYPRVLEQGYQPTDINIIDFKEYGLNFPGDVLFTHAKTLAEHPALVERMVRASLRGWAFAVAHPEEAVDIVLRYDKTKKLTRAHQLQQMHEVIRLIQFGNHPLGSHDAQSLHFVLQHLLQNKLLTRPVVLEQAYTNSIWEKVSGQRERP